MSKRALPEYSVLMPVYEKDDPIFFDAAIESMVAQTIPFHDLVIVCDGPLGNGLDNVLVSWGSKLGTRLSVHHLTENQGLGYALNEGLGKCACDIVSRMDSDDVSRVDRCEKLLTVLTENNLDLVGGAIEEFDKVPGDTGAVRMPPLSRNDINTWLKSRNPFNHVSVLFDRREVCRVGGYQPFPWMEDYWLWIRMIEGGCRCANIPDVVVDVRVGEGMYARRSSVGYLKSQVHFFDEMRKMGIISKADQVRAVILRTGTTLLPSCLVKAAYNRLLRENRGV